MGAFFTFLGTNKAAIGAIVSILEGIVVLINFLRKLGVKKGGEVESMSASPSKIKAFMWICNPINVFRKPQ